MKIVTAEEFKALPANTLYAKYDTGMLTEFGIKYDTIYDRDGEGIDFGSCEFMNAVDMKRLDKTFQAPLDLTYIGRDGLFENEQLYAVMERRDIVDMIEKLNHCLKALPPKENPILGYTVKSWVKYSGIAHNPFENATFHDTREEADTEFAKRKADPDQHDVRLGIRREIGHEDIA